MKISLKITFSMCALYLGFCSNLSFAMQKRTLEQIESHSSESHDVGQNRPSKQPRFDKQEEPITKNDLMSLHSAAFEGDVDAINTLIVTHGFDKNAKDADGETPLHYAARNGQIGAINALIQHGCNINAKDKINFTPLHGAVDNSHVDAIDALMRHGCNKNPKTLKGTTPLHWATEFIDDVNVINALIQHGCDINAKRLSDGFTPLHTALYYANNDAINSLLQNDIKIFSEKKLSPLEVDIFPDFIATVQNHILQKLQQSNHTACCACLDNIPNGAINGLQPKYFLIIDTCCNNCICVDCKNRIMADRNVNNRKCPVCRADWRDNQDSSDEDES